MQQSRNETTSLVDATNTTGLYTFLILDSSGFPVISYQDGSNGDLKLVHCNDANCAGGNDIPILVDSLSTAGLYASVRLDSSGFPVISYYESLGLDLKVVHCINNNCSGSSYLGGNMVDGGTGVGYYTSIALDSSGFPVVSYYGSTYDLKLVHCNDTNCAGGNETITAVDTMGTTGQYTSLILDSSGFPVISYYDYTNADLKLIHCNDANCAGNNETFASVDTTGDVGKWISMVLDVSGFPVMAYKDNTNGYLKLAHCGNANCSSGNSITIVDTTLGTANLSTTFSLKLDSSGFPVIAYLDYTNYDLKLVHCNDANCAGGNETITAVDTTGGVGIWTSLVLDGSGFPVISYYDSSNSDLKLVHCGNANCSNGNTITTVDSVGNVGLWDSLRLDSSGFPVISYQDGTNGDLKLVHCNDANCAGGNEAITAVDTTGTVGLYTSLILDSSGFPVISYNDGTRGDLKVAHCSDANCSDYTGGSNMGSVLKHWNNIYASHLFTKQTTVLAFDLAESYLSTDSLTAGEIVATSPSAPSAGGQAAGEAYVQRSTTAYQSSIIGVVSTQPGILLSAWEDTTSYPIALVGRVPVKVTGENGSIRPGDYITSSSISGTGMKATTAGRVVGVALESYDSKDPGVILMFVNPSWYAGTQLANLNDSSRLKTDLADVGEGGFFSRVGEKLGLWVSAVTDSLSALNIFSSQSKIGIGTDKPQAVLSIENNISASTPALTVMGALNQTAPLFQISGYTGSTTPQSLFTVAADGGVNMGTSTIGNLCLGGVCKNAWPETSLTRLNQDGETTIQIDNNANITASSTRAAFMVNQEGSGDIADFQNNGVSIMNISQNGEVKVMGSMLVDGRIMLCTGGQCSDILDSAVDETMADLGVEGKVVAGAFEGYCASGFVWVPGSAKYGTLPGFCVMNDLAHGTSPAHLASESVAGGFNPPLSGGSEPVWTNVSQGEAQAACQVLGLDYHLIGESEWLTIAENILKVAANDIDPVAAGMQLATSTEETPSSSPLPGGGATGGEVAFKLTNDNVIYNLAGSLAEWTSKNLLQTGLPVIPGSDAWHEYNEISDYKSIDNVAPDFYLTDAANNIGKIYLSLASGLKGFVRGSGGIYGLDLSHAPLERNVNIGFRCAK